MRQSARVILFNSDESFAAELRSALLGVDGVRIIAEVDEPTLLTTALRQFPADLMVVHLDPQPEGVLSVASELAAAHPEVAVVAISGSTEPSLLLQVMRAGFREFLTKPLDAEQLRTAVEKVASQAATRTEPGRLISVFASTGGAGASLLATNLAGELAALSKQPVALVDLDFRFGILATLLDIQSQYTIADLCDSPEQLDQQMIERAMVKHSSGIHLLARPNHFTQAEQITAAHCASVFSSLLDLYGYVVVDGPSRFDPGGRAVLDIADMSLLIIQMTVTTIRNAHRMLEALAANGYNLGRLKLVCNRTSPDSRDLETQHVEATLNQEIFHEVPSDWKAVSTAINLGQLLIESAPKSRVRQSIEELAGRIVDGDHGEDEPEENAGKSGGLLSRIFG